MAVSYYEVYSIPDLTKGYSGSEFAARALLLPSGTTTFYGHLVPEGNTLLIAWEGQHAESGHFPSGGIRFPEGYKETDP
jgi:hypothetical protein